MIAVDPSGTCKVCSKAFLRFRSTQQVCGFACAAKVPKLERKAAAADRRETRAKLEAIKPRSKWQSEAQAAFNAFIRARDAHQPCISCRKGAYAPGSWDAGHYLTVGARPELRFSEDNCHRQCIKCNQHLHGNLVLYRIGLIERRGLDVVERLEGPHAPLKLTVDELREIRDRYRAKVKALLREMEAA